MEDRRTARDNEVPLQVFDQLSEFLEVPQEFFLSCRETHCIGGMKGQIEAEAVAGQEGAVLLFQFYVFAEESPTCSVSEQDDEAWADNSQLFVEVATAVVYCFHRRNIPEGEIMNRAGQKDILFPKAQEPDHRAEEHAGPPDKGAARRRFFTARCLPDKHDRCIGIAFTGHGFSRAVFFADPAPLNLSGDLLKHAFFFAFVSHDGDEGRRVAPGGSSRAGANASFNGDCVIGADCQNSGILHAVEFFFVDDPGFVIAHFKKERKSFSAASAPFAGPIINMQVHVFSLVYAH
jgi:hypothetical protein